MTGTSGIRFVDENQDTLTWWEGPRESQYEVGTLGTVQCGLVGQGSLYHKTDK